MDHVVYLDCKAKEIDKLNSGEKTMIIRGAAGRKLPYGRVNKNDVLYFINNNAEGEVKAKAKVKDVLNSEKMSKEESIDLVNKNQDKLMLTEKQIARWAGKRYLVLIEVSDFEVLTPFKVDKSDFGNTDDWLPVVEINKVRVK